MELILKTDLVMRFLNYLWDNNMYLFFFVIICFSFWIIYNYGLRLGKYTILEPHSGVEKNKDNSFYERFMTNLKHEYVNEDNEILGYVVPPNYLYIYGRIWSTSKHSDLYLKLERDWKDQDVIDIRDTNVTSILISIIEDRVTSFEKLTIIHTKDQEKTLAYLKKYVNINFKSI
jgi:hypothetical protein